MFTEDGMYTDQGNAICLVVTTILKPLVKEWRKLGYKNRDIQIMLMDAISDVCLDDRLD